MQTLHMPTTMFRPVVGPLYSRPVSTMFPPVDMNYSIPYSQYSDVYQSSLCQNESVYYQCQEMQHNKELTYDNLNEQGMLNVSRDQKNQRVNQWLLSAQKDCKYPHPFTY